MPLWQILTAHKVHPPPFGGGLHYLVVFPECNRIDFYFERYAYWDIACKITGTDVYVESVFARVQWFRVFKSMGICRNRPFENDFFCGLVLNDQPIIVNNIVFVICSKTKCNLLTVIHNLIGTDTNWVNAVVILYLVISVCSPADEIAIRKRMDSVNRNRF